MLQDVTSKVQPRRSSTRDPVRLVDTEEASNILMTLSKQSPLTELPYHRRTSSHLTEPWHSPSRPATKKLMASRVRARSDPIILLAAAAAAIDNSSLREPPRHFGRPYERREFYIQRRSTDESARRLPSIPDHSETLGQDVGQAMYHMPIMKPHPKIKRNAMHSYIAYMIYTDLAKDPLGPKRKLQAMASMIKNEPHYHTQSMDQAPLLLSKNPYGLPPPSPPISQPPLSHRPLTAYLWSSPDKTRENVVLPPLASPPSSSTHL